MPFIDENKIAELYKEVDDLKKFFYLLPRPLFEV